MTTLEAVVARSGPDRPRADRHLGFPPPPPPPPGTGLVVCAPPDGYTLLLNVAAYAIYPYFFKNLAYDPWKDLIPVTLMARNVGYVLGEISLPVRSVRKLIALAKANPRKLNYADAGLGSVSQMAAELLAHMTNVKLTAVHYTGVPAMLTDNHQRPDRVAFPPRLRC